VKLKIKTDQLKISKCLKNEKRLIKRPERQGPERQGCFLQLYTTMVKRKLIHFQFYEVFFHYIKL
jgi:hypothetical protein